MRGWMGGKRRRVAVERRDPIARQRQFFARRRERLGNAVHPHLPPADGARAYLDSFRHGMNAGLHPQAPPREAPDARAGGGGALKRPLHISTDLLLLANPAALQSVVSDERVAKRRKWNERREAEKEGSGTIKGRREKVEGQEQQGQEGNGVVSNGIRIFNDVEERTPYYRPPVLPPGFLNSDMASVHQSRKRLAENAIPAASSRQQSQMHKRQRRYAHDGVDAECVVPLQSSERFPEGAEATTVYDAMRSVSSPSPRMAAAASSTFRPDFHNFSEQRLRTPPEVIANSDSPSLQRSSAFYSRNAVKPQYRSRSESPRAEFAKIDMSAPLLSRLPPVYSDRSDGGIAQTVHQRPLLESPVLKERDLNRQFPPVHVDSDSDGLPNSERESVPVSEYRSILEREPFGPDDLSAEVMHLEHIMLDEPDRDVRAFSRMQNYRNHTGRADRSGRPTLTTTQLCVTGEDGTSKENALQSVAKPIVDGDENRLQSAFCPSDLNVTTSVLTRNPIAQAVASDRKQSGGQLLQPSGRNLRL